MKKTITPQEAHTLILDKSKIVRLVDVRTPAEYRSCHIKESENIPLSTLDDSFFNSDETIVLICKSGMRSQKAQDTLQRLEPLMVEGGIQDWEKEGLPLIVSEKRSISIQRQVQITAGSLVLLGVIGGFTLSSLLFLLSGFIGAGLIFAGITDTCGLALILSKMPWNQ